MKVGRIHLKYGCDQCEYKATRTSNLRVHKQSKHEGVQYSCDQCEYKAGRKENLKMHKKVINEICINKSKI